MNGSPKILRLTLIVTLVTSGLMACVDQAQAKQGVLTADGPVTLTGSETGVSGAMTLVGSEAGGKGSNALTAFGGTLECPGTTYTGHKFNVTPHASISSGESLITVSPTYAECSGAGATATVATNGCDYVMQLQAPTASDTYPVKTMISCPAGKHVEILFYASEKHTEAFCAFTITQNTEGYSGLVATDNTNGTIGISGAAKGLTVDRKGEGVLCGEEAKTEVAELDLDIDVEDAGETPIGLVEAGSLGALISHNASGFTGYTAFGSKLQCSGTSLTAHRYNTTPHEFIPIGASLMTLTMGAAEATCKIPVLGPISFPVTIEMNGCDYSLEIRETNPVGNSEGTYGTTTGVVCPEAKKIVVKIYKNKEKHEKNEPFCSWSIPSQFGLTGPLLRDTGTGQLDMAGVFEGIVVERQNLNDADTSTCPNGKSTTAKFDVDQTFSGYNQLGATTAISLSD